MDPGWYSNTIRIQIQKATGIELGSNMDPDPKHCPPSFKSEQLQSWVTEYRNHPILFLQMGVGGMNESLCQPIAVYKLCRRAFWGLTRLFSWAKRDAHCAEWSV